MYKALLLFLFFSPLFSATESLLIDLSTKMFEKVSALQKSTTEVLMITRQNITKTENLLKDIAEHLKVIHGEVSSGHKKKDNKIMPSWVNAAQMSSELLKIIEIVTKENDVAYYAVCTDCEEKFFLLQKGDHTLWVDGNLLCGYDNKGNYFTQKPCGVRCVAGSK